jgi:hypothetical protein
MITLIGTCGLLFFIAGFFPALIAAIGISATSMITWDRAKDGGYKELL